MSRYAILSDIHANLEALEAVLSDLGSRRVDQVWFLGDMVMYGPEPNACLERLKEAMGQWPGIAVMGNNDNAVLCNQKPEDVLDERLVPMSSQISREAQSKLLRGATAEVHRWTVEHLTPTSRSMLSALPTDPRPVLNSAVLLHASPCEPLGLQGNYLSSIGEAEEAFYCLEGYQLCLHGHTHRATVFRETVANRVYGNCKKLTRTDLTDKRVPLDGGRLLVNPGSVGQPRDGDPRAAYAILDTGESCIEFHRVDYANTMPQTLSKLKAASLPDILGERLRAGS